MPILATYTPPDSASIAAISEIETLLSGALWEGNWPTLVDITADEAQDLIHYLHTIQKHPVTQRGRYGAKELTKHIKTISER